jgi:hypothetical protein
MERVVAKFSSFQEAERAEREYYRSLTPQQRLDILLELIECSRKEGDAAAHRFERVYRIVKLSPDADT